MIQPFPLAPSLWAATAAPPAATPPLDTDREADVCVVGGGFAGLSTALHLAEAGADVVLLEAREPGWGASGRNGGQVIPGLKFDPDELVAKFGPERGGDLVKFAGATAERVFELIARHRMDVPHQRNGWIQGAHSDEGIALAQARVRQWSRQGVAARMLDRDETAKLLGTSSYRAGWLDPRGGAIQPLSYARGLARAALAAGAAIHGDSPVTGLERRAERFDVVTARGSRVTARKVVVCANAYSGDIVPGLNRTFIDVNSFMVATAPLSDNLRRSIFPLGHVSSDTRKLLLYFRLDHTGRLLMGGRGPFREPTGPEDWAHLERVVGKMFPQLAGVPFEYRWGGRVAVTADFLPHLHEPEPGLIVDVGCIGRGVGLQTAIGERLAAYALSGDRSTLPFPLSPVRAIPFHFLRRIGMAAVIAYYRYQDGGVEQT